MHPLKNRPDRAFTLIELLVTIFIVSILAAIAFTSGKALVGRGQNAKCISNLHQIGGTLAAYASDNGGNLPFNMTEGDSEGAYRWYLRLNPYLGKSTQAAEGGWAPPSVFVCPSNDPHTGDGGGGIYKLWFDFGYACNLALMPMRSASGDYPGPPAKMAALPKRRMLVADISKDRNQFLTITGGQAYDGIVKNALIHSGGVNILWTDFSVSWLKAEDAVSRQTAPQAWY